MQISEGEKEEKEEQRRAWPVVRGASSCGAVSRDDDASQANGRIALREQRV